MPEFPNLKEITCKESINYIEINFEICSLACVYHRIRIDIEIFEETAK